jgi:hypothetical protein
MDMVDWCKLKEKKDHVNTRILDLLGSTLAGIFGIVLVWMGIAIILAVNSPNVVWSGPNDLAVYWTAEILGIICLCGGVIILYFIAGEVINAKCKQAELQKEPKVHGLPTLEIHDGDKVTLAIPKTFAIFKNLEPITHWYTPEGEDVTDRVKEIMGAGVTLRYDRR